MPLALNPKRLEPQARASQWRKPKISRAPRWRAPRRRPRRTSQRTGRQWGTRRKVKRWTTNWLRQKSKNHLALLLLLFLILGENKHRGCKMNYRFSSFLFCFPLLLSLFPPLVSLTFFFLFFNLSVYTHSSSLSSFTTSWLRLYNNNRIRCWGLDMTCHCSSRLTLY